MNSEVGLSFGGDAKKIRNGGGEVAVREDSRVAKNVH